jgi:hypothetical protein
MNRKTIFKGIALLNFIILITVFLLYRNGSLDHYIYGDNERNLTSPNGGTPAKISKDSTSKKMDSARSLRLSSSKSIVIIDDRKLRTEAFNLRFDSTKIRSGTEEKRIMYSSKSGLIVEPRSFSFDSSKIKRYKIKKEN